MHGMMKKMDKQLMEQKIDISDDIFGNIDINKISRVERSEFHNTIDRPMVPYLDQIIEYMGNCAEDELDPAKLVNVLQFIQLEEYDIDALVEDLFLADLEPYSSNIAKLDHQTAMVIHYFLIDMHLGLFVFMFVNTVILITHNIKWWCCSKSICKYIRYLRRNCWW